MSSSSQSRKQTQVKGLRSLSSPLSQATDGEISTWLAQIPFERWEQLSSMGEAEWEWSCSVNEETINNNWPCWKLFLWYLLLVSLIGRVKILMNLQDLSCLSLKLLKFTQDKERGYFQNEYPSWQLHWAQALQQMVWNALCGCCHGGFQEPSFFLNCFFWKKKIEFIKYTHTRIYGCEGGLCLKVVSWVSSPIPGYLNSLEIHRRLRLGCALAAHWRLCILCCHLANVESFLPALAVQPGSLPCLSFVSGWDITSCNYMKMLANITFLLWWSISQYSTDVLSSGTVIFVLVF